MNGSISSGSYLEFDLTNVKTKMHFSIFHGKCVLKPAVKSSLEYMFFLRNDTES